MHRIASRREHGSRIARAQRLPHPSSLLRQRPIARCSIALPRTLRQGCDVHHTIPPNAQKVICSPSQCTANLGEVSPTRLLSLASSRETLALSRLIWDSTHGGSQRWLEPRLPSVRFLDALIVVLSLPLWIPSAHTTLGGSGTQNGITITQNFSSVHYVDTKTSPFPTGFYAAYKVTNNTNADLEDVWVTLGSFTGSTVYLSHTAGSST